MASGPSSTLFVDTSLDSYRSFFDHDWAVTFGQLTDASRLSEAGLDLCRDWKGAAHVFQMPWLMISNLRNVLDGFTSEICRSFEPRFPEGIPRPTPAAAKKAMEEACPLFDPQEACQGFLSIPAFQLTLWSSPRICYGAVYYAYESFVRRWLASAGKTVLTEPLGLGTSVKTLNPSLDRR